MTATTPRRRMSAKRRNHIFSENFGICCLCERKIDRHRDRWIIEHIRALGLCGKDTNPNCGPAHFECAQVKTRTEDMPRIHKAKRQQAAHEGRKPPNGFWKPEGAVYDWTQRRYRLDPNSH